MDYAISVTGLRKSYATQRGNEKIALKGIDLNIPKGIIFGLLGPNGAGKSTLINILAGLVKKTAGTASVYGHDIDSDTRGAKFALGVVPQELVLDPFFTVREALGNHAGYYGIPPSKRRTEEIIAALGLTDKANAPARSLSGGMRRRLLIGKALVHQPKVLILDEPTAGVDVELREQLWTYVRRLHAEGTTVLLTTHYLEEAENLCDHIAVINHGEVVANGSKDSLLKMLDQKRLILTTASPLSALPTGLEAYDAAVSPEGKLVISYHREKTPIETILKTVASLNLHITDLATEEPHLEDVFKYLTKVN